MRIARIFTVSSILLLLSSTTFAEEVTLPAPVLEWAVYIVLIFSVCVAIGISIFMKSKNGSDDSLGSLLDEENPVIHSVSPDVSVHECVRRMNKHEVGAMLVMEGDQLIGIFTERDAIIRVLGPELDFVTTAVSEVMTRNPVWVPRSTTFEEARSLITKRKVRHLPVVENGKVLGVVSIGDLTNRLVID
jgi:CBS domain-containing protein